jgi:uncharacterized protein YuzE
MLKEGITIDTEHKLAYVYLAAGEVAHTEMVHPEINIDINHNGEIFGIEFLNTEALPYSTSIELECIPEFREVFVSAILFAQSKVLLAKAN